MNIQPVTLEGNTVRLEPLAAHHAADLAEAATPDLFVYHYPPKEFSEAGFREQVNWLYGLGFQPFAMVLKSTGKAVGVTTYLDIQPLNRSLEIGFTWIAKPYQGTKVNPEVKYLMLRHAFEDQGAVREGVLRKHRILPDGYIRDTVMYSIADEEWAGVKAGLLARLS
jgi:N-acetyltransferase